MVSQYSTSGCGHQVTWAFCVPGQSASLQTVTRTHEISHLRRSWFQVTQIYSVQKGPFLSTFLSFDLIGILWEWNDEWERLETEKFWCKTCLMLWKVNYVSRELIFPLITMPKYIFSPTRNAYFLSTSPKNQRVWEIWPLKWSFVFCWIARILYLLFYYLCLYLYL